MATAPNDSEPEDKGLWHKGQRALTAGLLLAVIFIAFEALAIATILPTVVDEIGGLSIYGWTFSGFMLANLIGITIGGHIADRHGLSLPFAIVGLVFAAGLIAGGFAPSMPLLVAARGVQGLGAGALGASISGAGPSLFALCRSQRSAVATAREMTSAIKAEGLTATVHISPADCPGVRRVTL